MEILGMFIIVLVVYLIMNFWQWILGIGIISGIIYAFAKYSTAERQIRKERREEYEKQKHERMLAEQKRQRAEVQDRIREYKRIKHCETHLMPFLQILDSDGQRNEEYKVFLAHCKNMQTNNAAEADRINKTASELGITDRI